MIWQTDSGGLPTLLLHSCCAVCSSHVLDLLARDYAVTVYYYNPNIDSDAEYRRRKAEQIRLIQECPYPNPVNFIDGDWENSRFLAAIQGLETEPEGGARCAVCFALRLEETARFAAEQGGFDWIATTLTVSPHKNAAAVNAAGQAAAQLHAQRWLHADFKKKDGFLRANQIARAYNLYRQDYCGCAFSRRKELP